MSNVALYETACRIRSEIQGYIEAGMPQEIAEKQVREESCAGWKVWQIIDKDITCGICGAPVDVSKKGNLYCIDICWKNPDYDTEREQQKAEAEAAYESYHGDWGDRD